MPGVEPRLPEAIVVTEEQQPSNIDYRYQKQNRAPRQQNGEPLEVEMPGVEPGSEWSASPGVYDA